jgi:replicative DNA helicase
MRKADPMTEKLLINGVCNCPDVNMRHRRFQELRQHHFGTQIGRDTYDYIADMVADGKKIPTLRYLISMPGFSPSAQTAWSTVTSGFVSDANFEASLLTGQAFAENRDLLALYEDIAGYLRQDKLASKAAKQRLMERISQTSAQLLGADRDRIVELQPGDCAADAAVHGALNPTPNSGIKLGWPVFDDATGGLMPGQVMLLTANTGGCKSALAINVATNLYLSGNRSAYLTYEMNELEILSRILSRVTRTEYSDIRAGRLSMQRRQAIEIMYRERLRDAGPASARLSIVVPIGDKSIRASLVNIAGRGEQVVIIDHATAAGTDKGRGKESREEKLTEDTRQLKRWAEDQHCAVILLAQLNAEGATMYSKGIEHNVNYRLSWKVDAAAKMDGYVAAIWEKGRDIDSSEPMYFNLELQYMSMENVRTPPEQKMSIELQNRQPQQGPAAAPSRRPAPAPAPGQLPHYRPAPAPAQRAAGNYDYAM